MHILMTGGTGLIGRKLCRHWLAQGHRTTVWSRDPDTVAKVCGPEVLGVRRLQDVVGSVDAVVNLAGAPIADHHWTKKRKVVLWSSRILLTETLLAWMKIQTQKPAVLISGSAVGWYGNCGDRKLTEDSGPEQGDFSRHLCVAWEEAALRAEDLGVRVVLVRTGLVLAEEGGFLSRLLLPFKLALGGPIGDGRQWMPWVHIKDQISLIDFLLHKTDASGPYNACAPCPVRNMEFAKTLGMVLHRPSFIPMPAFVLKIGLGELSGLLLGGQRAMPKKLLSAEFTYQFPQLKAALEDLFGQL